VTIDIPVGWLAQEPELPDRCARHGLPVASRVTFAVKSAPRIGSRRKLLLPAYTAVDRAAEYLRQVRIVKVTGWPLCARCLTRRAKGLALAAILLIGGVALMAGTLIAGAVADPPPGALVLLFLAGFAAMLISVLPFGRVGLARLTGAEVTADGTAVRVTGPSPEFTAGLPPAEPC
jgi:hypothetical protein